LLKEEDGQGIMEYVIIGTFVSIIAIAMVKIVGLKVNNAYTGLNSTIQ